MPEERRHVSRNKFGEGGFNPSLSERRLQPRILQCTVCKKLASPEDAEFRTFNTGKCGYCAGNLEPY